MTAYQNIIEKLESFYKKYYTNELLKGSILFGSAGLLYLIIVLLIEYFLWLSPINRTILFWCFIAVEFFLLWKFIFSPLFQLFNLRKGINLEDSSRIIGGFFPEVQDKLLNVLQLKNSEDSELVLASIEQKSKEIQPVPFQNAINFKTNIKYVKFLFIPVFIWLGFVIAGFNTQLEKSLTRVVNYNTAFVPPAPFTFQIDNSSLNVIQGKPFTLKVSTLGDVVPAEALVKFKNQEYYLQKNGQQFTFTFSNVSEPIDFFVESNSVQSPLYRLNIIKTPTIQNISLNLEYPKYIKKKNETMQNASNLLLPEGTKVTWLVNTNQTDSLAFVQRNQRTFFSQKEKDFFEIRKPVFRPFVYEITSSNADLKEYEKLQYSVEVVKDEFPKIQVLSNIDSVSRGPVSFGGQISDDYGLKKLELVYYNEDFPEITKRHTIKLTKENVQTFFYDFPTGLNIEEGVNYELFLKFLTMTE